MRGRVRGRIWASLAGESPPIAKRWAASLGLLAAALVSMLAAPLASGALPDGRVYEIVSPIKKNGNGAGAFGYGSVYYGISSPSGDRMLYGVSGTIEGGTRGIQFFAIGNRSADGWKSFDPLTYPAGQVNYVNYLPAALQVSTDLTRFSFNINGGGLVPGNPSTSGGIGEQAGAIYVNEPGHELSWVTKPSASTPVPPVGETDWVYMVPAGQSPDLKTFYFSYIGTLTPEDASRAPNVNPHPEFFDKTPRGFYRWSNGTLVNYGSLPDGSFDPYGAVPAGGVPDLYGNNSMSPGTFNGQVSGDGQQAVFVSPDSTSGSGRTPQLYVRRGDEPSVLVSRSEVTSLPSATGPYRIEPPRPISGSTNYAYAYGSLDGSHVYFESIDPLTSDAPVDATEKAYLFDVETKDLQYLAAVRGEPIAAAPDLSNFVYGRTANGGANPGRVGLWNGTTATNFATSPSKKMVLNGRSTPDGKVFLFETNLAIPGFNNGGGFTEQVYRYDVTASRLECISCPPETVTPESNAELSHNQTQEPQVPVDGKLTDARAMSADGQRVFFDTGDPLVKQDANGVRDVYLWEQGKVSLISSGRSSKESYFLDNSESGNDVFFTTSEGLNPEDTDGAYDVYDARVGGGFSVVGPPAPCSGGGCQTPEAPPSFNAAGSSELNGAGNVKERMKKPKCAKGKVRKHGRCVKKQQKSKKRTATTKQGSGK